MSEKVVKPGYKKMEVGVIPEDWEVKRLGDIADVDPENLSSNTKPDFAFNYISLEQVDTGRLLGYSEEVFRTAPSRARRMLRIGDVLMSTVRPNLMAHLFYQGQIPNAVCSTGFAVLRTKKRDADPGFLFAHLFGYIMNKQIEKTLAGSNYPSINGRDVKMIEIPCPPTVKEQTAIAATLSDADALITSLDTLIAKKRAIKQAAMQQLLTGRTRLPGFEGEWETKRLGELTTSRSGGTPPTSISLFYDGGIPWVSITDMTSVGKWISITERTLSQEGLDRIKAQLWPPKTVLYAMYASIGECCMGSVELSSSQAILGIQAKSSLDSEYLYYHLVFRKDDVRKIAQHGTQANLNAEIVRSFQIPLPAIQEQTAIATVLSDMDTEITVLEHRLEKTRQIKQGMMQQLLTGRIRLPALN